MIHQKIHNFQKLLQQLNFEPLPNITVKISSRVSSQLDIWRKTWNQNETTTDEKFLCQKRETHKKIRWRRKHN
jgi:hypothetical protein